MKILVFLRQVPDFPKTRAIRVGDEYLHAGGACRPGRGFRGFNHTQTTPIDSTFKKRA